MHEVTLGEAVEHLEAFDPAATIYAAKPWSQAAQLSTTRTRFERVIYCAQNDAYLVEE